jgi:hypothetical protein
MSVLNYLLDTLNIDSDELIGVDMVKIDRNMVYLYTVNGLADTINVDTVPDQYIGSYKLVTINGSIVLEK